MDIKSTREQLIRDQLKDLSKFLPYADGPQRGRDLRRIQELKDELSELEKGEAA